MPAKAGVDYQSVNLHGLGFIPGQTSITVSVQVIGDNINEPNKDFFVNLIDAENATVVDAQGVGTIVDDDPLHLILDESGPASDQATALESILLVRDPFHVQSIAIWLNLGADRRTRVMVFASSLQLAAGELPSSVV